jgi:hypothetical protein
MELAIGADKGTAGNVGTELAGAAEGADQRVGREQLGGGNDLEEGEEE